MNFSRWVTGLCIVLLTAKASAVGLREEAPDFTLKNYDGTEVTLSEAVKEGTVALVFYRSANW